jgi:hypothetical protein
LTGNGQHEPRCIQTENSPLVSAHEGGNPMPHRAACLSVLLATVAISPAYAQDVPPRLALEPTVYCRHVAATTLDVARATSGPESYYIATNECPAGDETITEPEFNVGASGRTGKRAPARAAAPAPAPVAFPRPVRPERPSRYIITVMFCSADNCEITKPETTTYDSYAECSNATLKKSASLNDWITSHRNDGQRSGEILCLRVSQTFR